MKKAKNDLLRMIAVISSRKSVDRVIRFVGDAQERFDQLVAYFLGDDAELARRAAWPMSDIAAAHPQWLKKWFPKVIAMLDRKELHPAMYRNIFRILQDYDIPEKFQSKILDASFAFMIYPKYPSAIRAFAMTTAMNIATRHAGLQDELQLVVQKLVTENTPSIRARARNILKQLAQVK